MDHSHRNSICVEDASILRHEAYPGEQFVLRVQAPKLAARARPGCFAHLQCDPRLPLRRPMSIMRADADAGWVEMLYKRVGTGTAALAEKPVGHEFSIMGPIGRGFEADPERPRALLLGGGVGIPPMVFLASELHAAGGRSQPLVLMGSEAPFPFTPRPSQIMVPGLPAGVIACMPLLEDWGIASRLASLQGRPGCYEGFITDLAHAWLKALDTAALSRVMIHACGPVPMLKATARLAGQFDLPCQVSLEERMACATGGCAGCTVRTTDAGVPAMARVCVDGPVFAAGRIDWAALAD